jgi:hypothetical protein
MAPKTPSNVTLLFNIGWIFREITPLLKSKEKDELRRSYSHFAAFCVLITDDLNRLKRILPSENDHVRRMLAIFQSLITESPSLDATGPYPRLNALDHRWNEIEQTAEAKLKLIRSCFNLGSTPAEREAINNALEKCHDDLEAEFPDDSSRWTSKDFIPLKKRSEPSYVVWAAANVLYEALLASKNCQCHSSDNYHTRLCLGTWRKPDDMGLNGYHDFDMFLSLEAFWQEIHIQTVKKKKESEVKFMITGEKPVKSIGNKPVKGQGKMRIKDFCKDLQTAKEKSQFRLNLQVENDQLFKLISDKRQFQIDTSRPPVSLEEFIQQSPQVLTAKTKRVLAVLLSYTVLHLHGTPFLKSWGPSSILFLWTKGSSIPVRPYLQSQVMSYRDGGSNKTCDSQISGCEDDVDINPDDIDPDDFDPDDIDPDEGMPTHQCPSLVTLAMMLLEIYLGASFRLLAKKYKVELGDGSDPLRQFMDVDEVFKHCKSEIPENSKFHLALNNCLEMNLWQDEEQQPLDEYTLRSTIYSEVVKPLEDELNAAFTYISIDELDSIAQTLDLSSWGRLIEVQGSDTRSHQQVQQADHPWPPNQCSHLRSPSTEAGASSRVQSRGRTPRRVDGYKDFKFYDSPSDLIQQGSYVTACSKLIYLQTDMAS